MGALAQKTPPNAGRYLGGWQQEDFVASKKTSPKVIDFWNPTSSRPDPAFLDCDNFRIFTESGASDCWAPVLSEPAQTSQPHITKPFGRKTQFRLVPVQDPWCPLGALSVKFGASPIAEVADRWFEQAELPAFDPDARRAIWVTDTFERPLIRDARSKAKWIVAILQPPSIADRARWLHNFETVFLVQPQKHFFRKIRSLASEVDHPEPLLAAIEIKGIWQDRLDFQKRRASAKRIGSYITDGGTLSWAMALRIAVARCDYDPQSMIDPDWLDDWRLLRWPADGYWFFADYAVLRAQSERFEDWDLLVTLRHEESKWSGTRPSPIDDISGMSAQIRSGAQKVPTTITRRYIEWLDEQGFAPIHEPELAQRSDLGRNAEQGDVESAETGSSETEVISSRNWQRPKF